MKKNGKYRVLGKSEEVKCISCGNEVEEREHQTIGDKELSKSFYFSKWFMCFNPQCRTKVFMLDKYKVMNHDIRNAFAPANRKFTQKQSLQRERAEQFKRFFSL